MSTSTSSPCTRVIANDFASTLEAGTCHFKGKHLLGSGAPNGQNLTRRACVAPLRAPFTMPRQQLWQEGLSNAMLGPDQVASYYGPCVAMGS
eukprot:s5821_g2.t1